MATVEFQKPRPRCRICGTDWHVVTGHNPRSPLNHCCATCGQALYVLKDWLKIHKQADLPRLMDAALALSTEEQPARKRQQRAG